MDLVTTIFKTKLILVISAIWIAKFILKNMQKNTQKNMQKNIKVTVQQFSTLNDF